MANSDELLKAGDDVGHRYRIEALIGEGGMSWVYRARDTHLDRLVALKILRMAAISHAARLEREAQALAALGHPTVVGIHDVGALDDGRPYIVLEFIEGENLSSWLSRHGPVAPDEMVKLCRPMVGALCAAHAQGIIHRDLKPENLIRQQALGREPSLRLLDFGIAAMVEPPGGERLTKTGAVFGTPEFMAPEQAMGRMAEPATDVWALGALFYCMLTGDPPFQGEHPPEILCKVIQDQPEALPPSVPTALRTLITACMNKAPGDRPASAAVVLDHLEAMGTLPPVRAPFAAPRAPDLPKTLLPMSQLPGLPQRGRFKTALFVAGVFLAGMLVSAGLNTLLIQDPEPSRPEPRIATAPIPLQPDAAQPDAAQPDAARPDAAQPDAAQPDAAQPDAAQPDAAKPDAAQIGNWIVVDQLINTQKFDQARRWLIKHPDVGSENERKLRLGLVRLGRREFDRGSQVLHEVLAADASLISDPRVVLALVETLKFQKHDGIRELLAGPLAASARPGLLKLVSKERYRVRWRAIEVIKAGGGNDQKARLIALRRDLSNAGNCKARKRAVIKLGRLKESAALPDLERQRRRPFFENICMGDALDIAIRRLRAK